jgi:hypothetical protein
MDGEWDSFMTWSNLQWLAQNGFDIESHTYSHQDLNAVSAAVLTAELSGSKEAFLSHGIQTGELALPYGDGMENTTVIQAAHNAGYLIARDDNIVFDLTNSTQFDIQVNDVSNSTNLQYLDLMLREAQTSILIYHHIDGNTSDPDTVTPENFAAQMNYLKTSGYFVTTISNLFFDTTPLPSQAPTTTPSPSSSTPPTSATTNNPSASTPEQVTGSSNPVNSQANAWQINSVGIALVLIAIAVCVTVTVIMRSKSKKSPKS